MSDLLLYNTMTKKEESFVPLKEGEVTMYTCGPTVYGRPHIGNYSSFLMADLLARWLEVSGYKVTHAKNITDVGHLLHDADQGDDKVQKQAEREQVHPLTVARRYEEEFLEDEHALNMREPQYRPRASEYVPQMLAMVKTLLEKGNAYETEDGIYFSVESFPAYGKLSGNTLKNLSAGARIEVKESKKHPADFALWKKCVGDNAVHILRWSFATGKIAETTGEDSSAGFPGWHIECSAMSSSLLGETIDIHTGGEDNIFPHHECEIAQSEAAMNNVNVRVTDGDTSSRGSLSAAGAEGAESEYKPFVKYWLHRRRIDMGEEKMSKSLGNILTISDVVEKGFSPLDLRYLFLSVHYRTNLKFSWKGLEDAKKARRKIVEWMGNRDQGSGIRDQGSNQNKCVHFRTLFAEAMNADLNTPEALAVIFECMAWSRKQEQWSKEDLGELQKFIDDVQRTFGCFDPEEQGAVPTEVQELVDQREHARANKDFQASDRLRDDIRKLGYQVRDTDAGQEVKKC
ncbi:MAG: cysteine--tRNA ligase [Candidatus Peribacteraceae bacterium]